MSDLLEQALRGEEIAIGWRGKPEVRLVVIDRSTEERPLGDIDVVAAALVGHLRGDGRGRGR